MLDNLLLVSKQVGVLFVLMAVGCLCNRCRLLNAVAIKGVTGLLIKGAFRGTGVSGSDFWRANASFISLSPGRDLP